MGFKGVAMAFKSRSFGDFLVFVNRSPLPACYVCFLCVCTHSPQTHWQVLQAVPSSLHLP